MHLPLLLAHLFISMRGKDVFIVSLPSTINQKHNRITSILVSHFLIDLQEASRARTGNQLCSMSSLGSVNFARTSSIQVDAFGSSIPAPWQEHHNDEEEEHGEHGDEGGEGRGKDDSEGQVAQAGTA